MPSIGHSLAAITRLRWFQLLQSCLKPSWKCSRSITFRPTIYSAKPIVELERAVWLPQLSCTWDKSLVVAYGQGESLALTLYDQRKAFDVTSHTVLLTNLSRYRKIDVRSRWRCHHTYRLENRLCRQVGHCRRSMQSSMVNLRSPMLCLVPVITWGRQSIPALCSPNHRGGPW